MINKRCFYFTFLFTLAFSNSLPAQVIEDNTLSTGVNTENNRDFSVDAGEQRGNNLFHSFQEFSIPNNGSVYFDNGVTIQNIISRVTGSSISEINGVIKSNGAANLFLLNPNGIIFGENASLNIGGSFVGTTAESLTFTDGTEFSTKTDNAKPLLTISVPLGLQFGSNPGEIVNRANSSVTNPFDPTGQDQIKVGLSTSPGKTFALFGGNITFDGGAISAPTGNIELGSVTANSLIILEPVTTGWQANYDNVTQFQDLVFDRLAFVDASGEGAGDISIRGRNLQILDGSGIISNTLGNIDGGTIEIQASDLVEINGSDSTNQKLDLPLAAIGAFIPFSSSIISDTVGQGDAADIKITSNKLELLNGAKLQTRTFAVSNDLVEKFGDSGDIIIKTSDAIRLEGVKPLLGVLVDDFRNIFPIPPEAEIFLNPNLFTDIATSSSIDIGSTSNGSTGNINISTNRLELRDSSTIANSPSFFSTGDGGDITINAQESIELYGSNDPKKFTFSLISSNTFGSGSAGDINLTTNNLLLRGGSGISTGTFDISDGGNIFLNANDIDISGTSGDGFLRSGFGSEAFGSGNAGNVVINTKNLSIADQGQITLRSFDSGTPGNLIVNANSIELNSNAIITVENTASLEGGNIQLQVQDNLTLTGNSLISAQAFNNANGGNVDIDANFVIAPPQQNNDILASAVLGSGGNITISAEGIFGIEERNSRLSNLTNDIDASSEFGTSGIVTLFFPSFTAANGLFNLPSNFIDVIYLFNNSFCKISQDSSFTITGRGGMAYEPEDDLVAEQHWSDWRIVDEDPSAAATQPTEEVKPTPQARQIALVQGWIRDDQGNIVLTDKPVTVSPHKPGLNNPDCNQVKSTASNIEH